MKKFLFVLYCGFCLTLPMCLWAQEKESTLNVISDITENLTNADGSGLYWEILKAAFQPLGLSIKKDIQPWRVSLTKLASGEADLTPAVSSFDECCNLSKHQIDISNVIVISKEARLANFQGEATLLNKKVAWVKGYNFLRAFKTKIKFTELNSMQQGFEYLETKKLDFVIDIRPAVEDAAREYKLDLSKFGMANLTKDTLHVGFSKNEKGRKLQETYDQRIEELFKSGELQNIYKRWGYEFEGDKFSFIFAADP